MSLFPVVSPVMLHAYSVLQKVKLTYVGYISAAEITKILHSTSALLYKAVLGAFLVINGVAAGGRRGVS